MSFLYKFIQVLYKFDDFLSRDNILPLDIILSNLYHKIIYLDCLVFTFTYTFTCLNFHFRFFHIHFYLSL